MKNASNGQFITKCFLEENSKAFFLLLQSLISLLKSIPVKNLPAN